MENALRYHAQIDLSQKNTSHAQLIRLTGRNKDVLEVGPATGYVTKLLQQRGCRVWCIEIDPDAAKIAAEFCQRMVVDNVETMDLKSTFPHERFDVVTFGDVLEHLIDPLGVLVRVREVLKPGGYVVASVPNIAHGSIRLSLLAGRFDYLEKGLLDRTHLRFFTLESLGDLFSEAGYRVRSWRRVLADPFATEVVLREDEYPHHLIEAARGDLGGLTYQVVLKAYPAQIEAKERTRASQPNSPGSSLLDDLRRFENEKAELHAELRVVSDELGQKEASLIQITAVLADREAQLRQQERSLQELDAHLAMIEKSLGYKLLEAYRRRIRRLFPSGSMRGVPYRGVVALARRVAASRRQGHALGRSSQPRDKYE